MAWKKYNNNNNNNPDNISYAYRDGVRYIGICVKCCKDVSKHLLMKGYYKNTAYEAIELLKNDGYLDDSVYARKKVADILCLKPVSSTRIRRILFEKGIDFNIIEDVVSNWRINDLEVAKDILTDRYGSLSKSREYGNIKKAAALLKYRGFGYDVIDKLLFKNDEGWC